MDNNLKDTFKRVWMRSTALVRKQHPNYGKVKKPRKCENDDDRLVESFIIQN